MHDPLERPPLPGKDGQNQPTPARPQQKRKLKQTKEQAEEKKPGRLRKQAMPILVMAGLIVGIGLLYSGVRAAREALGPQAQRSTTLPKKLGGIQLGYPEGWKKAPMQNVARASGRWGMGSPGSTKYAFFVTRYPLQAKPSNSAQSKQILLEAQNSLYNTGAPRGSLKAKRVEVAKQSSWYYHFQIAKLDVQIWLVLQNNKQQTAMYQFSCQSPSGARGGTMRVKCREAINGLRF